MLCYEKRRLNMRYYFVTKSYRGNKALILLSILQMSISINGIFRFDINDFKWLRAFFMVFFLGPANLQDANQNTENIIYIVCYQALI